MVIFYGVTDGQAGKTGVGGTVFQMTPAGVLRVIKRFTGQVNSQLLYHQKKLNGVETLIGVETETLNRTRDILCVCADRAS